MYLVRAMQASEQLCRDGCMGLAALPPRRVFTLASAAARLQLAPPPLVAGLRALALQQVKVGHTTSVRWPTAC